VAQTRGGEKIGCGEKEGGDERQWAGEEVCVRCERSPKGVAGVH